MVPGPGRAARRTAGRRRRRALAGPGVASHGAPGGPELGPLTPSAPREPSRLPASSLEPAPPQPCDPASSGARGVGRASRGHVTSARENPSEGAAPCSSRLRAAAIQRKGALEKPGHVGNGVARSLMVGDSRKLRSPLRPGHLLTAAAADASVSKHLQLPGHILGGRKQAGPQGLQLL